MERKRGREVSRERKRGREVSRERKRGRGRGAVERVSKREVGSREGEGQRGGERERYETTVSR